MYGTQFSVVVSSLAFAAVVIAAPPTGKAPYDHVIAISIDGFHGSDVEKYVVARPKSVMASLLASGIEYRNAYTSAPSDSFPGTAAQYTGGSPRTHRVWYDDVWDWTYYPPGSECTGPIGTEVEFAENLDYNNSFLFSGGIDPGNLPQTVINGKCVSVYPHQRLLTNTVFELVAGAGYQTAYVDKHPAYDLVRGPSGIGLTTGYFPETAAVEVTENATIEYDKLHVQAWLDYIDGITPMNSSYGKLTPGHMPTLMGGNFQAVSVTQKTTLYNTDLSLNENLLAAIDFVDTSIGSIIAKLKAKGLYDSTLIIIASKHGQSPIDPALLTKVDPDALLNATGVPTAFLTSDTIGLLWLNSSADVPTAVANLRAKASLLHIQDIIYGQALIDQGYGDPNKSPRVPHIIVVPAEGVIYTTSKTKTAEHGGISEDDRHVACFLSNPRIKKQVVTDRVETKQLGPTMLLALGLDPSKMQAAVAEDQTISIWWSPRVDRLVRDCMQEN